MLSIEMASVSILFSSRLEGLNKLSVGGAPGFSFMLEWITEYGDRLWGDMRWNRRSDGDTYDCPFEIQY